MSTQNHFSISPAADIKVLFRVDKIILELIKVLQQGKCVYSLK
jgi:hypothetical protein